jgi:hypothetical protein
MDGFVTMGDIFATLDERRSSAMPAFLEQGLTPESELADPTSFIVGKQRFTPEKTSLEEEQKQDLWLAVGRDYKIKPEGSTFQRWAGEHPAASLRRRFAVTEKERVEEPPVVRPEPAVRKTRTRSQIVRRTGLGQLPEEILPSADAPGVTVVPVAREAVAPKVVPETEPAEQKAVGEKSRPWLVIGGLGLAGIALVGLLRQKS